MHLEGEESGDNEPTDTGETPQAIGYPGDERREQTERPETSDDESDSRITGCVEVPQEGECHIERVGGAEPLEIEPRQECRRDQGDRTDGAEGESTRGEGAVLTLPSTSAGAGRRPIRSSRSIR